MDINIHTSNSGQQFILASELHQRLNITTPLRIWFPRMIDYGFQEGVDYTLIIKEKVISYKNVRNSRGRKGIDWEISIDMAKNIAVVQKSPEGMEIRNYLLNLDKQVNNGELINKEQAAFLLDLASVLGYVSLQTKFEKSHYKVYGKPNSWWRYRADLLGYSTQSLQQEIAAIGKKYRNQRQALTHLDPLEIIRMGVIDFFAAMGKSPSYSQNMGNMAKQMAPKLDILMYDDTKKDAIDFRPIHEKKKVEKFINLKGQQLQIF